ncbi:MAG: sigma-70 family RNA polymerase sigma factor [Solirubrobacterales bacterium]
MVERHERSLRRTARRFAGTKEDAEDAFQRAIEICLRKAPGIPDSELIRWTHTVTRHEALAVRRDRERHRLVSGSLPAGDDPDGSSGELMDTLPSPGPGPAERVERDERVARSCEALAALKPQEVRALALKAEGYSYEEIGARTGWTYTKINRCMAEGRKRFFELFAELEKGEHCQAFAPMLSAWSDGELEQSKEPTLKLHLRSCGHCRAKLAVYRGLPRRVLSLFPPGLPLVAGWWTRAQEVVVGGLGDKVAGATIKTQALADVAAAKKATAVVAASAAAIAGAGVADPPAPREKAESPPAKRQRATATPDPAPAPAERLERSAPTPAPEPPARQPAPAPQATAQSETPPGEFEFEGAESSGAGGSGSTSEFGGSSTPAARAPSSASRGGEFGGP